MRLLYSKRHFVLSTLLPFMDAWTPSSKPMSFDKVRVGKTHTHTQTDKNKGTVQELCMCIYNMHNKFYDSKIYIRMTSDYDLQTRKEGLDTATLNTSMTFLHRRL